MPADERPLVLVRYRAGSAPESQRVVHVVPMPTSDGDGHLVALCGKLFTPTLDRLELMDPGDGMPCVLCLVRSGPRHGT